MKIHIKFVILPIIKKLKWTKQKNYSRSLFSRLWFINRSVSLASFSFGFSYSLFGIHPFWFILSCTFSFVRLFLLSLLLSFITIFPFDYMSFIFYFIFNPSCFPIHPFSLTQLLIFCSDSWLDPRSEVLISEAIRNKY